MLAFATCSASVGVMMDTVDFKTLKRPNSPNTYLVAPEGMCDQSKPDEVSQVMSVPPTRLFAALADMVEANDAWHMKSSDPENGQMHFVSVSRLLKFKDDISVLILPAQAGDPDGAHGSRVAIYSRSRVGHSDLGANRKRVKKLLQSLNKVHVKT